MILNYIIVSFTFPADDISCCVSADFVQDEGTLIYTRVRHTRSENGEDRDGVILIYFESL